MSTEKKKLYMITWWMGGQLYAALFDNKDSAEAAAIIRNALFFEIQRNNNHSKRLPVVSLTDYFKNKEGTPAEWREIMRQIRIPRTPIIIQTQR